MSLRIRLALLALLVALAAAATTAAVLAFLPYNATTGAGSTLPPLAPDQASLEPTALPARDDLLRLGIAAAIAAAVVSIPATVAALWLARGIETPLAAAASAAEAVAAGDLGRELAAGGEAGGGRLSAAIGAIQQGLVGLVGRIRASVSRLTAVETDTRTALERQQRTVAGFGGATHEISAAVAQISATGEQLLSATGSVMAVARAAAGVADEGREGLDRMTASMQQLDEAMNAFTRKLATISQRASGITSVVTTIAKVAEQTNLLSVNATIEAEKAGESGRGFRIVAQEIRRLADQTAQATKDIERMVRDMQAAVAGGTMEMDRFRNEVSGRIGEVAEVSEKLGRVIEPVQSVTRALEQVHEGMEAQSQGARQIREAMESLRGDAAESSASLGVFTTSLAELRAAIAELEADTVRFGG
jgi:methyl-accepting chemotaxis protein WspA